MEIRLHAQYKPDIRAGGTSIRESKILGFTDSMIMVEDAHLST